MVDAEPDSARDFARLLSSHRWRLRAGPPTAVPTRGAAAGDVADRGSATPPLRSAAAQDGCSTRTAREDFGAGLYDEDQAAGATDTALSASLGCGVPTAVADLHEGETVLDLARARAPTS